MIKNYLTTAVRTLLRNRIFSLINVLGLSVGISAAIVIFLIVQYDTSFEQFQKDKDRIFRVVSETSWFGRPENVSAVPYSIVMAARKDIPGVEESVAVLPSSIFKVSLPGQPAPIRRFKRGPDAIFTDDHYFRMFPHYQWLAGSPAALHEPFRVVLTESHARDYFPGLPSEKIIGRTLVYNDSLYCTVAGIVRDVQEHTDLSFKEFVSLETARNNAFVSFDSWNALTSPVQLFVRIKRSVTRAQVQQQLDFLHKLHPSTGTDSLWHTVNYLQPLTDIHYASLGYDNYNQHQASKPTLYGLMTVALFLLLLGSINFINLTTASAGQRAKEIGIRKTLGGSRRQLTIQFLGEAFLLTLTAALLSLALTPWLLHLFSDVIPSGLHADLIHRPGLFIFLAVLIPFVSLLSGAYPALVLSRLQPVQVLKDQSYAASSSTRSSLLRRTLTTFQFVIAQAFIISTLVVGSQIHYFLHMDMGFKKDAIVYCMLPFGLDAAKVDASGALFEDRLRHIPGITGLSIASAPPMANWGSGAILTYKDDKTEVRTDMWIINADTAYMHLYGIRLLAGANYAAGSEGEDQIVVNRTYTQRLGFTQPQQALGKMVRTDVGYRIVGVVEDFHHGSLHELIKPVYLHALYHKGEGCISIQLSEQDHASWQSTLDRVQAAYKDIYPGENFEYHFFDDSIARLYDNEVHMSALLRWATGLTIFISCLGLLGLVMYTTSLRTKEIGIRKVLGASVTQIVTLLSKDFIKLVGIAFVIAVPIAWYATHRWMENFAYRATTGWGIYILSGLAMLLIALLTLGTQTMRAANANPVKSLRSE